MEVLPDGVCVRVLCVERIPQVGKYHGIQPTSLFYSPSTNPTFYFLTSRPLVN